MADYIEHNLKALEKILGILKAVLEKTNHGVIKMELVIFDRKITKLKLHGEKSIK